MNTMEWFTMSPLVNFLESKTGHYILKQNGSKNDDQPYVYTFLCNYG